MTPIRRKTRSQRQGEKFNVGKDSSEEEIKLVSTSNNDSNKQQSISTSAIEEIRAELSEELSGPPIQSEYQDESHSWNEENQLESEDYWHFLGRYE